jgi:hypothetical protein
MSAGLDCSPSAWSAAGWDLHTDEPGSGSNSLCAAWFSGRYLSTHVLIALTATSLEDLLKEEDEKPQVFL